MSIQQQAKKRKWSRFKVKNPIKARVAGEDRSRELTSISLGGCAFTSNRRDSKLLRNPDVELEFEVAGQTRIVQGKIQYFQFMPQTGMDANLLGIEFSWPDFESRQDFGVFIGKAVTEGKLEHQ